MKKLYGLIDFQTAHSCPVFERPSYKIAQCSKNLSYATGQVTEEEKYTDIDNQFFAIGLNDYRGDRDSH